MEGNWTCDGDLSRPSCLLSSAEYGELDSVAAVRIVISCLSLMGALTIISITLGKREIFNHKVHPIFVLSIADAMLSLLYIVGSSLWLRSDITATSRGWCFFVTLPTVILQCVAVNLTVLYAILAHAGVKQKCNGNQQGDHNSERVWSNCRTILSYLVAWLLPMVLVMLLFAVVVTDTDLLQDVNNCSCWCRPSLGNIIPSAKGRDPATIEFRGNMRKLVVAFAAVIGTHFLAGFIILIIVYGLMIRTIRRMRERNATRGQGATGNYGAVGHALTEPVLERAEFQAKRRVTYFLIVFMVTGFFNLILCVELMFFDIVNLGKGEHQSPAVHENRARAEKIYYVTLCLQSVTITQQGFLNAIVYGWTREDFLSIMALGGQKKRHSDVTQLVSDIGISDSEDEDEEEPGQQDTPGRRRGEISREHSFNSATYNNSDYEDQLETSLQQ